MGHAHTHSGKNGASHKKSQGIIGNCIYFIWLVLCMSLFAWFFLVLELSVYQLAQGKEKTQQHIQRILDSNTDLLKKEDHFLASGAYKTLEWREKDLLDTTFSAPNTLAGLKWAKQHMQDASRLIEERTPQLKNRVLHVWDYILSPLLTLFVDAALIVETRLYIFLLSLPLFLLCLSLGCVDGLIQRDIRKFQSARESTYFFHRIKKMGKPCFFLPLFLYLIWPYAIHFLWFLAPMAFGLAVIMQVSLRSFKKYV